MSLFTLVWSYLRAKPFNTFLNAFLLALGVAVISIILLATQQLQEKMASQSRGIDLVVGAKGSPLQLILCNIYHVDFPTGNIKLREAEKIARHRMVKKAVPLALGDSYQGVRIVGTTPAYGEIYGATLSAGDWFTEPMQVVAGATAAKRLQLSLGSTFVSAHGLNADGQAHEQVFRVTGILAASGSVLDNLLLTPITSIWHVHDEHEGGAADTTLRQPALVPGMHMADSAKEITALLLRFRNPIAALQLPRWINSETNMQAASPAFETSRLFAILGVGVDILQGFAAILIFIAALSIFIALYNSLKERQYDLAIMRAMGAGRSKMFLSVLLEGATLTLLGSVAGLLLAHGTVAFFATVYDDKNSIGIDPLHFLSAELWLLAGSIGLGILCSLLPAIRAYRTNIHQVLAGG